MQEIYITITKTAAPAGTGNGCKNTSTRQNVGTPIVRRKKRRVNLRPMTAALLMLLLNALIWVPTAYYERGYWAIGSEWLLTAAMGAAAYWIFNF